MQSETLEGHRATGKTEEGAGKDHGPATTAALATSRTSKETLVRRSLEDPTNPMRACPSRDSMSALKTL